MNELTLEKIFDEQVKLISFGFLCILTLRYFKLLMAILKGRLCIKIGSMLLVTAKNSPFFANLLNNWIVYQSLPVFQQI